VLLVTTRHKTLNSDTLFSSKEGRSASKTAINGIVGQHGPGEAHMHQSTQDQCYAGSGTDLHWTVARQSGRINPELLDDGTRPTLEDFLHLVQCHCKTSLPLISITRLLPSVTRFTRFTTHARGLLYFTNYHIHDYGDFRLYNKTLDEVKQHTRRVFIGQGAVHID
jgi:hypothetical protein